MTFTQRISGLMDRAFRVSSPAAILALAAAVPLAMRAARKPDGIIDRIFSAGSFTLLSVPPFIIIVFLVLLVSIKLGLGATGPAAYVPLNVDWITNLESISLAAVTIAAGSFVLYFRVLRSDMIATLQEDYIAMARAKGLKPSRILLVHALKPSSLTLVTVTGINIGRLIGGTVIVESIFALPGIGRLLLGAIYTRDLIILQGVVLFVAFGYVLMNFIVDMLYAVLDPRIRHGHA